MNLWNLQVSASLAVSIVKVIGSFKCQGFICSFIRAKLTKLNHSFFVWLVHVVM